METITRKLGSKGEIVIPNKMRKKKNITSKTPIQIIETKNGFFLLPTKKLSEFVGLFGSKGVENIEELDLITEELLAGI